jgi:tRNA threonylcarbamoyladenosine biosynthesis protein TsaB
MLLLAADTSGKHGSIGLAQFEGREYEMLALVPLAGGTFSAQLVPQIAELLGKHGFTKKDLDGFVVVSGPGSFTGLRVGLAAIKALAEVLQKPIAAVSLLEVIAFRIPSDMHPFSGNEPGDRIVVMDAGRGEVFAADYRGDGIAPGSERLMTLDEVAAVVTSLGRALPLVTPDQAVADAIAARLPDTFLARIYVVDWPKLSHVVALGWERIKAGQTVSPEDLEANYIRRSDAEIFSKPGSL